MIKRIGITTGDSDGIGFEVTAKALDKVGPHRSARFYVWRSEKVTPSQLRLISKKFRRVQVSSWPEALRVPADNRKTLVEIVSNSSPARWVETAAQACRSGHLAAMATAPLSKQTIAATGLTDIGHTDILKRVCSKNLAFMAFVGKKFNVLLATGHLPIGQVAKSLSGEVLLNALLAAKDLQSILPKAPQKKPIALLGLNPHCGDSGLIGTEEQSVFPNVLAQAKEKGLEVVGPLVPDAAFHEKNWSRYSVFVACYHDQGLIPFKTVHGFDSGVHLTLGLPLKRTSVDHGTAKDIFGKNVANPNSMVEALRWATEWAVGRQS